jgi:uncharacterized membrane protein YecN with MAPEG domain
LTTTLATAGALGLIYIALAFRVIAFRFKHRVSLGDGGNPALLQRIRSHGNFAEYVPLLLILMGLIEQSGGSKTVLMWSGALLIVSRVLHVVGVEYHRSPNPFRVFGVAVTFFMIISGSIWALRLAFMNG